MDDDERDEYDAFSEGVYDEDFDEDFDETEDDEEPTVPCPSCGEAMHEESIRCPACGHYRSEEDSPLPAKPLWITLTAVVVLAAMAFWVLGVF